MNKRDEVKAKVKMWGGKFSTKRYVEDLTVTPNMAEYFLTTMNKNRHIRPMKVKQYKDDILNGRFVDCPSLICFDTNGHMIDGQHRMQAIVLAGIPVKLSFKFDFAPGTIFDKNVIRTTADTFYMSSLTNDNVATKPIISMINAIISIYRGQRYSNEMSDSKKADFANEYGEELLKTESIANKGTSHAICNKGFIKAGIFAALMYGIDEDTLYTFTDCVNNLRAESDSETAATVFGRQILTMQTNGWTIKAQTAHMTEEAINRFVKGKKRDKGFTGTTSIYFNKIKLDV